MVARKRLNITLYSVIQKDGLNFEIQTYEIESLFLNHAVCTLVF